MAGTGARKRLADLGAVASGLAHEIRNPLNSLSINSQILVEMLSALPDIPPEKREELLSLARANMKTTARLNDLLTEFLRFARPPATELVASDLNRIVTDTVRFMEVDLARRGIGLSFRPHRGPLPLLADEKQLKQAFLNLLLNAMEAMDKEEKVIRVATGRDRDRPFVRIADNGRGIPPADRKHIFRLFFTTRRTGSGLGLPIVRRIVREHGGRIGVRSREGAGTTVTVVFPSEREFSASFSRRGAFRPLPERVR